MQGRIWIPLSALLVASLSGCVGGGDSEPQSDDGPARFTDDTGAVEGALLDEEGLPVDAAQVGLGAPEPTQETRTDDGGRFSFSNIEPGTYRVIAQKIGYGSAVKQVEVVAGQVTSVQMTLSEVAIAEPHHVVLVGDGRVQCGTRTYPGVPLAGVIEPGWYTGVAVCGVGPVGMVVSNFLPPDKFLLNYDLPEAGVQEMVLEMEWESNQATGRGLSLAMEDPEGINNGMPTYGNAVGESPLRIEVNQTTILTVNNATGSDCVDTNCTITTRVFAAANTTNLDWPTEPPEVPVFGPMHKRLVDVGIVIDQRFTQYLTTFHLQDAPESYSALQDS